MEANKAERTPLSEQYNFALREEDGVRIAKIDGPFGGKIKAELSGDQSEITLKIDKMMRPTGGDDMAPLVMLKGLVVMVKEELEKEGGRLGHIEIPIDGSQDLSHLFHMQGIEEIFGKDEVQAAKDLYNPRPDEVPKRRAGERPTRIWLTLEEMTKRLKEYEERYGEIRQ